MKILNMFFAKAIPAIILFLMPVLASASSANTAPSSVAASAQAVLTTAGETVLDIQSNKASQASADTPIGTDTTAVQIVASVPTNPGLQDNQSILEITGKAGTTFQQNLQSALAERHAAGLPVPPSVSFEFDIDDNLDQGLFSSKDKVVITGRTRIHFEHPSQAGLEKWSDLIVEDIREGTTGYARPGDYTQMLRDELARRTPGIWDQYEFGYEPRDFEIEEKFEVNFTETDTEAIDLALENISTADTIEEILLGFTILGPQISKSVTVNIADGAVIGVLTVTLDWALGLRLPMEVDLSAPDSVNEGSDFFPTTSVSGLDWSGADFVAAGVAAENGNEFVARFEASARATVDIDTFIFTGRVFDESIGFSFDESQSFATPFGPGATFPLPPLDIPLWGLDLGLVNLTAGVSFQPNLGSDRVTADWTTGGSASGAGTVTYTDPAITEIIGPVTAINGPDLGDIQLDEFKYWFTIFVIKVNAFIEINTPGIPLVGDLREDGTIFEFDLGALTGGLFVDSHAGTSDTVTLSVPILDVSATVNAGSDQSVNEGDLVSLDPATFTDPGILDTHTATIDWGDGTVDVGVVTEAAGSGTVDGSHAYGDNGVYTVEVEVCESTSCGSDSLTVTVANVAPTTEAGVDQTVNEGDNVSLAASFTDPGFLDTHTATVDWGDGSPVDAGVVNETGGNGTVSATHAYGDNDDYTVTVEVCDDDGACHADTLTVTVLNVPPTVGPIDAPDEKVVGATFTASASFTDPGWLDTHTAAWDWGDGNTTDPATLTQGAGFGSVEDSYAYLSCGLFTITLSVTDDDGGVGTSTHDIESLSPEEGIMKLMEIVEDLGLQHGIENALLSKLSNALAAMERGQDHAAENLLRAFIHQVEAQTGKKIDEADADVLIQWAEEIIAASEAGLCSD